MLLSMLHGLGIKKAPVLVTNDYRTLIADAFNAPIGKSYGGYVLDDTSTITLVHTANLPDLSGYLKKTQVNFLLERSKTSNGDFIIASCEPFFPGNLGTPVIDGQYLESIKNRKFISYQNGSVWSAWKEINSGIYFEANFNIANTGNQERIDIDPTTLRRYNINLAIGSNTLIHVMDNDKFFKNVVIVIEPETASYTLTWTGNFVWADGTPPPSGVAANTRINVRITKESDGTLVAHPTTYSVA